MRTKYYSLVALMALLPIAGSTLAQPRNDGFETITGEIIDTLCAEHRSHEYMMQQMKSMGTDKVTCIQKCEQLGGKLALFNASTGAVYTIANPEKAELFAGKQVQITGALNKKKVTISEIKSE